MLVYLSLIESDEDKSKFEKIYERYKGLMFYTAMQILNHKQDAEDAVHQAFVSIIENLDKISESQYGSGKLIQHQQGQILRLVGDSLPPEFAPATWGIGLEEVYLYYCVRR